MAIKIVVAGMYVHIGTDESSVLCCGVVHSTIRGSVGHGHSIVTCKAQQQVRVSPPSFFELAACAWRGADQLNSTKRLSFFVLSLPPPALCFFRVETGQFFFFGKTDLMTSEREWDPAGENSRAD